MKENTVIRKEEPAYEHPESAEDREEAKKDGPERERKFYLDQLPEDIDLNEYRVTYIVQGYTAENPATRYRIKRRTNGDGTWNDKYYRNIKIPGEELADGQHEKQEEIDETEFNAAWKTITRSIAKLRWKIPFAENAVDLDKLFDNGQENPQALPERFFAAVTTATEQKTGVACPWGIFLAEIEYTTREGFIAGTRPDWLQESSNAHEITNERWGSNSRLAELKTAPNFADDH
jgi:hypothetical protein